MSPHFLLMVLSFSFLGQCRSYTLRSSVSWALSNDVVERDLSQEEEEEVSPAVLGDGGGLWKHSYPAKVPGKAVEKPSESVKSEVENVAPFPSRLFSYRMEEVQRSSNSRPPPPHQETARTARYISHYSEWGHLATISTQDKIKGLPFGNIFSVSDGPFDNSTGVIYLYVTAKDDSVSDLKSNPYASLTFSEAEGDFCRQMIYDPEDPRCARLTLTGKMVTVGPEEVEFAKASLFTRHPAMKYWPEEHQWFFMKLEVIQVWLQDWFGTVSLVPLDDYFKATPF